MGKGLCTACQSDSLSVLRRQHVPEGTPCLHDTWGRFLTRPPAEDYEAGQQLLRTISRGMLLLMKMDKLVEIFR